MNWFKQLLGISDKMETDYNGLPKVTCNIPMPKVKPPKADKDISEPILSFVKCVQENPKRFRIISDYSHNRFMCYQSGTKPPPLPELPQDYFYILKDLKTNESWSLYGGDGVRVMCYSTNTYRDEGKHTSNPEWLTRDERVYLINSIKTIFKNREGRKERVTQLRKERRVRDERNRLKEIYQ